MRSVKDDEGIHSPHICDSDIAKHTKLHIELQNQKTQLIIEWTTDFGQQTSFLGGIGGRVTD